MAPGSGAPLTDRDQASATEAVVLARRAREAQRQLAEFSQAHIDTIVARMAAAAEAQAEPLARLAVDETGYGVVADKVEKNLFAARDVHAHIEPMRTVGVVRRDEARRIVEIAEPFGVVAAIVPSTNPTSTAIYKLLISIKARCAVVLSPHPSAARSIGATAQLMQEAGRAAGLPEDAVSWLSTVTLHGTQTLMRSRETAVILATGGLGLVRAAYSAGKPAYGVGPGNAPCYVESSADIGKAADDILAGKCFDNGLLCSSPNSIVVDRAVAQPLRRALAEAGGHVLSATEVARLSSTLITAERLPNPALVGKSAMQIADAAGLAVPPGTRALIAPLEGVGRAYPLSIEKLCPVLSYYEVEDWREGCARATAILQYGGLGHTMSVHSQNDQVILEFGLRKPAFRICVNTSTTHGSIGLTTGLAPAMTLGCGGLGGNATSDNITPLHLVNLKRLAYELRPRRRAGTPAGTAPQLADRIGAAEMQAAVERALDGAASARAVAPAAGRTATPPPVAKPEAFICEDDVRQAARSGRRLSVGPKTILTPAARDLGDALGVLDRVDGREASAGGRGV
jgi:acetaldehyde dehydrogenase (acetylating)